MILSPSIILLWQPSLIDASEMVDTYGAGLEEIRGFLQGGWGACMNAEGECTKLASNATAVCYPVLRLVK